MIYDNNFPVANIIKSEFAASLRKMNNSEINARWRYIWRLIKAHQTDQLVGGLPIWDVEGLLYIEMNRRKGE